MRGISVDKKIINIPPPLNGLGISTENEMCQFVSDNSWIECPTKILQSKSIFLKSVVCSR